MRSFRRTQKERSLTLTGITKAGYFIKRDDTNTRLWKRYFFTLNGHTMTQYMKNSSGLTNPECDMLLTTSTRVQNISPSNSSSTTTTKTSSSQQHILSIEKCNKIWLLRGKDCYEIHEWKKAIDKSIADLSGLKRGFLAYKTTRVPFAKRQRFFFMLHKECMTYHSNENKTSNILGIFPLTESCSVSKYGSTGILIKDCNRKKRWKIIASSLIERGHWIEIISKIIYLLRK